MARNKEETLADKISNILTATPSIFDPEDNLNDYTSAKVDENAVEEENNTDAVLLSQFRKRNTILLDELDKKYAGKKSSRKSFAKYDDGIDYDEENESATSDDSSHDIEEEESDSKESSGDEEQSESSQNDSEESDNEKESEEVGQDVDSDTSQPEVENIKHLREENVPQQVKRAVCVRNQLNIWEDLLEMRIRLQKCLVTANKMPQSNVFQDLKMQKGDDVQKTQVNVSNVLDKLLDLQTLLMQQYSETKTLLRDGKKVEVNHSDEEIPSDSDIEKSENDEDADEMKKPVRKKRKLCDYETEIGDIHHKYSGYRNSVIQKWNEKTRIASGKKTDDTYTVLNQIEYIMKDKTKLIKRTQTKRSNYKIVGKLNKEDDNCDTEIFDDDDFYHQLLRELIEVKSADITDPIQLGKQWVQLQSLRNKMKKKVDTKATKGRKIRYTVHSKLVNFMPPIETSTCTDDVKTELFKSLFGGKTKINS